ncbi:NADPH-dependent FMN reductase [Chromohalobacter sarecensis]|uniref:NADPH-dependent FMN reductase n=1 Tax=Chromohalobacter sarecensis TaxID=245294 RepID=A0ABV9D4T4_9GAMM|nr:NAD(P)H-dependent oxidoreductase [Chromohalobacter sarecensis]MCK0714240.1 NAD(P)H-dependent oxidoreductase [Chromohalobacter sarecensis]
MKFLIFLGSTRDSQPPKPPRVGERVAQACRRYVELAHADHEVEIIDPLDIDLGTVFKPHFAYAQRQAPESLDQLADKIRQADGYIMVSPEYNHGMSPALAHLLNHFGSSLFAYKPSLIVTYSGGQWGGVRAAVAMRSFLSELGCLPVSAMLHIPKAGEVFQADGTPALEQDTERWKGYFGRATTQLLWWAEAAHAQREAVDPHAIIENFTRTPAQRNAPDEGH